MSGEGGSLASALGSLRATARARGLFSAARSVVAASAPGRLDVMGGIADYSGSLVLQLPLAVRALALAAPRDDGMVRVVSVPGCGGYARDHAMPLAELLAAAGSGRLRTELAAVDAAWFAYAAGCLPILLAERSDDARGLDLLLASNVPEGKGVSSSAAVEVACTAAAMQALGLRDLRHASAASRRALALLCQRVENEVAGAACGVMDQMTAACGREGELLRLLCQPAEVEGHVPVPEGFGFWAIDSGVRHAVSGSDYTSVRTGAFMGFRILADRVGLDVAFADGRADFHHPRWGRYLANVSPSEWAELEAEVPLAMSGAEFTARCTATSDHVTRVDAHTTYAVRQPTAHPVHEHHRVRTFAAMLPRASEPGVAELLGELMYQSHASYGACGLGCAATDALVRAVRERGTGLFGAKITGGGSGGSVAVFGHASAEAAVHAIAGGRTVLATPPRTSRPVLQVEELAW